jgi:hypothetical protein
VLCLCYACVMPVLCLCYACVMPVLCLCYVNGLVPRGSRSGHVPGLVALVMSLASWLW